VKTSIGICLITCCLSIILFAFTVVSQSNKARQTSRVPNSSPCLPKIISTISFSSVLISLLVTCTALISLPSSDLPIISSRLHVLISRDLTMICHPGKGYNSENQLDAGLALARHMIASRSIQGSPLCNFLLYSL